jgi:uncharacterized phiE125 gp8 family phage protein
VINYPRLSKKGRRKFKVTTDPASEPITVDELKLFARIDSSYEDTLLTAFIVTARQLTEKFLRRALITQTITLEMDYWSSWVIELPRPPLISVTSIVYVNEDDTTTTYSSDNYYVRTNAEPGQLVIKNGSSVPINTDRYYGGYRITYTAGYGASASDVPQAIRDAIKIWATELYEGRATELAPPAQAAALLMAYKPEKV